MKSNKEYTTTEEILRRANAYAIRRERMEADELPKAFTSIEQVTANALLPSWEYHKGSRY